MTSQDDTPKGELILYQTEDGRTRIECRFEDETIWLTQALMAELFQTTLQNINLHLQHIYEEGELDPGATIKSYLMVRQEGKPCQIFARQVLSDPRVQEALRDVVFVRYDIDTPAGRDAMYRCQTRGVPAVFGIDHGGFIRMRTLGAEPTADEFLAFLRQARAVLGAPADPAAPRTR